jgi:hypothetical protein
MYILSNVIQGPLLFSKQSHFDFKTKNGVKKYSAKELEIKIEHYFPIMQGPRKGQCSGENDRKGIIKLNLSEYIGKPTQNLTIKMEPKEKEPGGCFYLTMKVSVFDSNQKLTNIQIARQLATGKANEEKPKAEVENNEEDGFISDDETTG